MSKIDKVPGVHPLSPIQWRGLMNSDTIEIGMDEEGNLCFLTEETVSTSSCDDVTIVCVPYL